jgi:three-Cys-motif partner protein
LRTSGATGQLFGGDWTEQKLDILKKYLRAYATALKKQPFRLAYVDAFAGTGYRELKQDDDIQPSLFEDLAQDEPQRFLEGSARIALKIDPPFVRYLFVEADEQRFAELARLKEEFPDLEGRIQLVNGEANSFLRDYCTGTNWGDWRAVVFLDPFGMQTEWSTMEAIAQTKAIDLWVLFPLGTVMRLLPHDPSKMPNSWHERLDKGLGSTNWFDVFYKETSSSELLGQHSKTERICTPETISAYYLERLRSIFTQVADNPCTLYNSKGSPLFQFFFAAGNPKGAPIAVKIAQHILKEM